MIHGFWRWPGLFDAADLSVRQLGAFLHGVTDRAEGVDS
jgi:hypothetical protein